MARLALAILTNRPPVFCGSDRRVMIDGYSESVSHNSKQQSVALSG